MKKKILILSVVIFSATFFVIGIPFIINEAYKSNSGYMTMWGAPEVLSYYGTIFGSIISVATIVITILFTRKQILRDSYLQQQNEKWEQIERVISKALIDINPTPCMQTLMEIGRNEPCRVATIFQQYQVTCRVSLDELCAYLSDKDFSKVKELISSINSVSDALFKNAGEVSAVYMKLYAFQCLDSARKAIKREEVCPGSYSAEELNQYRKIITEVEGMKHDEIDRLIRQTNAKVIDTYDSQYRPLLKLKGAIFDSIYKEVVKNADDILYFWRKK